jgi:hypothetical protein
VFPAADLLKMWPPETHASLIAESLGTSRPTVQRWRAGNTYFTDIEADMYACRIGLHPANIWRNWA